AGKYYTESGGMGTLLNPGTVITEDQTIYIYAPSPFNPVCYDETSFDVLIIPAPEANPIPAAMRMICDEDGNNDGITSFDLTQFDATILGTQTGPEFSITYYESLADANTSSNPITTSASQVVYVRVDNLLVADCYDIMAINFTVNK